MSKFPSFGSIRPALLLLLALAVAACDEGSALTEPLPTDPASSLTKADRALLVIQVRDLARERGITAMPLPPAIPDELADLGQMLLFDPILSGNRDISCMTCHHPDLATGDARSLAIGQGGAGLGAARVHPTGDFIPRNAPPLFNLHLLKNLFWDGRVSLAEDGTFHTPAGSLLTPEMTSVFQFGAISAIGLFPVLSREEMRGVPGENELADIADTDMPAVWSALMGRLGAIGRYRELFEAAYPGTPYSAMSFAHAANAMAAFLLSAFTFDNTAWDRFLAGNEKSLTDEQLQGAVNFMNAPCSQCHSGPGFSNDGFHNVALAQFGPGQGNGPSGRDDFGRMNVTGDPADIYRFRTTMLRNVELTGPYGHAGEFADLALFIDHYSRSADKLRDYSASDIPDPLLRPAFLLDNKEAIIATRDPLIVPVAFDSVFTRQVTAFMLALTDKRARDLARFTPRRVPSGLLVER